MMERPFSQACENNQQPILDVIQPLFEDVGRVIEIGSGTGQHAAYFSAAMPDTEWQGTDLPENHSGYEAWRAWCGRPNMLPVIALDVLQDSWPVTGFSALFSANTLHIMHWPMVIAFFNGIGRHLAAGGVCAIYGPFNYDGTYTSASNARFDTWLQQQDPGRGIRNFEDIDALAQTAGLALQADHSMPANNRLLVWKKTAAAHSSQGEQQ